MDAFALSLFPPALPAAYALPDDDPYIPLLHALTHDDDLYQLKIDELRSFVMTAKMSTTNYFFMDWVNGYYSCGLVLADTPRHRDEALAYGITDYITWECSRDSVTPVHPSTLVNNLWSTRVTGHFYWTSIVPTCIRNTQHSMPLKMIEALNTVNVAGGAS